MRQIDQDLFDASKIGDLEKAKRAILNGADVNVKGFIGDTPLHHASENGHDAVVSLLLENGADINAKDYFGWTTLHFASWNAHEAIVSLLLEKGADINAKRNDGSTPLHHACENGHDAVVSLLLENGADPTITNGDGETPLQKQKNHDLLSASRNGDLQKAKQAIENGADVNVKDKYGWTPLDVACKNGYEAIVSLLLEHGADVTAKNNDGRTPLHEASRYGHKAIVSLLLKKGANVNAQTGGWTPLHWASENGHDAVVSILLDNGADVNAEDDNERTPLHLAISNGEESIVSKLLENGANVNAKDDNERTPLHLAILNEAVVSLLLEKGANVNAKDKGEETPLYCASMEGDEAVVSLLLEKGAEVNVKDGDGWTPLHKASWVGHDAVVSVLLKHGANVDAKSGDGATPLHLASAVGDKAAISLLLEYGADVNAKKWDGETPLHSSLHNAAATDFLFKNITARDNHTGDTPLDLASIHGHEAVISLLLEKGANPTIADEYGQTPLQIAQEYDDQNCVVVFEEFAQRQQGKKRLERQDLKMQEETKKRPQPREAVASAKKNKDESMELELAERGIYNRALAQGNTTLGRIRLMMCGPYGVGKTSIVRSLRGEPFNDEYNSTEGIDAVGRVDKHTLGNDLDFSKAARQWIVKNESPKSNNVEPLLEDSKNRHRQDLQSFVVYPKQSSNSHLKEQASEPELKPSQKPEDNGICITIWDFAGQIEYHCMHQMFFRSNCLYLLVLDLQMDGSGRRSSEEEMLLDAQKWLNAIVSSAGPDIGLIVVGTHADAFQSSDAATDRLEGLLEKLENSVADVEYDYVLRNVKTAVVDNKNDVGISELKTNLYETAKGLLSDILVPLSWLRLLEKVREELPLKDNEICAPLENVQNLARTIGIMEKDQLCEALSFFDRVGELTYIQEHELSEWVFTEPQLLLNAMKSLLVPARNLKKFLQRKQQRELEDYGFLENEALKAIWNQYKNQEQLRHLMRAMGLITEFPDGVAIPCRLPKKPTLWEDKPMEKGIVVTTKYSTHLPPSLYGHALAGLLHHHGTPEQELRLLSQTTSCIKLDSSKLFLQNELAHHTIAVRAILENEQPQHAITLRVRASAASSHMPDETVLKDTLVKTVKALVTTLHLLARGRFKWMTVQSCVKLPCHDKLRDFTILKSERMSKSDSAEIAPFLDSFVCSAGEDHLLTDAVQDAKTTNSRELQQLKQEERPAQEGNVASVFLSHTGRDETARNFTVYLKDNLEQNKISAFYDIDSINCGEEWTKTMEDNVANCRVFVAILSPTYFKQYWCMRELQLALNCKRTVLPVYYSLDGPNKLPQNKADFCNPFRSKNGLTEEELDKWWINVSEKLRDIQDKRRSHWRERKDGDRILKNEIVQDLKRLLG